MKPAEGKPKKNTCGTCIHIRQTKYSNIKNRFHCGNMDNKNRGRDSLYIPGRPPYGRTYCPDYVPTAQEMAKIAQAAKVGGGVQQKLDKE